MGTDRESIQAYSIPAESIQTKSIQTGPTPLPRIDAPGTR